MPRLRAAAWTRGTSASCSASSPSGNAPIRGPRRRWPGSRTTCSTSARSRASSTWASAATSTAPRTRPSAWTMSPLTRPCSPNCSAAAGPNPTAPPWPAVTCCAPCFGARPEDFVFARQVHGAGVRVVGEADRGSGAFDVDDAIAGADALVTSSPGVVLAILTADCVPIVLHDPVVGVLACVHAGWRGTVARVSAAVVAAMRALGSRPSDVIAGIGPAVAAARYQVGPDVHQAVTQAFGPGASAVIRPDHQGRWLLDLWAANRHALREAGVPDPQIHTTTLPTGRTDPARHGYFFSDRSARPCGRLALVARLRAPAQIPMDVTT